MTDTLAGLLERAAEDKTPCVECGRSDGSRDLECEECCRILAAALSRRGALCVEGLTDGELHAFTAYVWQEARFTPKVPDYVRAALRRLAEEQG